MKTNKTNSNKNPNKGGKSKPQNSKTKGILENQREALKAAICIHEVNFVPVKDKDKELCKYTFTRAKRVTNFDGTTQLVQSDTDTFDIFVDIENIDHLTVLPSLFHKIRTDVKTRFDFVTKPTETLSHSLESTIKKFLDDQNIPVMGQKLKVSKILVKASKDEATK